MNICQALVFVIVEAILGKLKRLFRGTSPDILKSYFDQRGMKFADDFDWALEAGKLANTIEEALAA